VTIATPSTISTSTRNGMIDQAPGSDTASYQSLRMLDVPDYVTVPAF
jgi:hypothetical protein